MGSLSQQIVMAGVLMTSLMILMRMMRYEFQSTLFCQLHVHYILSRLAELIWLISRVKISKKTCFREKALGFNGLNTYSINNTSSNLRLGSAGEDDTP